MYTAQTTAPSWPTHAAPSLRATVAAPELGQVLLDADDGPEPPGPRRFSQGDQEAAT
ncbi:hypothetical protein [Sorangium sp. So ce1182]|uniref:hypothetical protein n=1 Tax=Sorangium sp. So ce1182 TaxID=3133334 RepID=UPI003F5E05E9